MTIEGSIKRLRSKLTELEVLLSFSNDRKAMVKTVADIKEMTDDMSRKMNNCKCEEVIK